MSLGIVIQPGTVLLKHLRTILTDAHTKDLHKFSVTTFGPTYFIFLIPCSLVYEMLSLLILIWPAVWMLLELQYIALPY